jgi:hypothetical protein
VRAFAVACILFAACGNKSPAAHPADPVGKKAPDTANEGSGSAAPTPPPEQKVGVALQVEPPEANVTIDDLVVGRAMDLDAVFALAPGLHTLVITQPGYKTYRMEFSVTDKTETFSIHLDKK